MVVRHVGDGGLGELEVGEHLAEHRGRVPRQRLIQRTPRETQSGGSHRGAEDVQRLHRHLEALARFTQAVPTGTRQAWKRKVASG